MASIRKRGNSYLLVASMGYDHTGKRRVAQQKTVRPPEGLTPKQKEKWLNEQAVLFERECKDTPLTADRTITLARYVQIWLRDIAPDKLANSTLAHDKQDIDCFLPYMGGYKLTELRPEHFRKLYAELRKQTSQNTGMPLSEYMVEGVHACLYGILSDAMEDDFVFRRHDSQDPMTPSTFTWRFKMILKKNSLPEKLNVHSLRHSNASLLIAGGADVATVAGLLGHSQPSTTLDIYTHAFDKNKKAASEALQQGLDI